MHAIPLSCVDKVHSEIGEFDRLFVACNWLIYLFAAGTQPIGPRIAMVPYCNWQQYELNSTMILCFSPTDLAESSLQGCQLSFVPCTYSRSALVPADSHFLNCKQLWFASNLLQLVAGICECVSKYYRDFRIALRIVCPFIPLRIVDYVHLFAIILYPVRTSSEWAKVLNWIGLNWICSPCWTLRLMVGPEYWRPRAVLC